MAATRESSPSEEPLPPGFVTIEQIRDLSNDVVRSEPFVNVIGVVKDQQAPYQTSGTDCKCTLTIVDHSIRGESNGIKVVIFRPMEKMPKTASLADLILIRKAKVQMYRNTIQLMTNYGTEFHFLGSTMVPQNLGEMKNAPWVSYPPTQRRQSISETRYATWLHTKMEDLDLPSDTEFNQRTERSMNITDKFRLLKDVKDTGDQKMFVNIIGEVVKIHDSNSDSLELYLSDYTPNTGFYNYEWGAEEHDVKTHDEFGYSKAQPNPKKLNKWPGPHGKMTIQICLWENHASYVRDEVKPNSWVSLSNVRIKIGKQGFLEGVIHGDNIVKVNVLEPSQDPLTADASVTEVRLQEAISRKFQWKKKFNEQKKAIQDEDDGLGSKRKRGEEEEALPNTNGKLNGKQRRKLERAAAGKKVREAELKKLRLRNLNENIKCQSPNQEPVSIKDILTSQDLGLEGKKVKSPFTNTKYRANVRVVDYFPARIEDFAVGYRSSEFDVLEDYSGSEDTDLERSKELFQSGQGFQKNRWEWRFALQVEDVEVEASNDRMWLMVDNQAAQMLLNIPNDATSLRSNPELLSQLKEQLFKLWGDLEEKKSAVLPNSFPEKKRKPPLSSLDTNSIASSPPRGPGAMPISADSDEENPQQRRKPKGQRSQDSALEERDANVIVRTDENGKLDVVAKNKGFTCCIQQYGVKIREGDPSKANAGEGRRWQRMFGLFGTMID